MKDKVEKAREALGKVVKEFEPAADHAVGAGRELLLAIRAAVDAELNLLDKAAQRCKGAGRPKPPPEEPPEAEPINPS